MGQSPPREHHSLANGIVKDPSATESRPQSKEVSVPAAFFSTSLSPRMQKADRASHPMSFASILGPSNHEPSPKLAEPPNSLPPSKPHTSVEGDQPSKVELHAPDDGLVGLNGAIKSDVRMHDAPAFVETLIPAKPRKTLTSRESEKVMRALADMDDASFSDVDTVGFYEQKERFKQRSRKRAADLAEVEADKHKVSHGSFPLLFLEGPADGRIASTDPSSRRIHQVLPAAGNMCL